MKRPLLAGDKKIVAERVDREAARRPDARAWFNYRSQQLARERQLQAEIALLQAQHKEEK